MRNDPIMLSGPTATPIGLDDVKAHLKIDSGDEDATLTLMIAAATACAETYLGRALIAQTLVLNFDRWPESPPGGNGFAAPFASTGDAVRLPRPPLRSVTEVKIYDRNSVAAILDPSLYFVSKAGHGEGRILLHPGIRPPLSNRIADAIEITYEAGYGGLPEDVPFPIREGILILIAHWFENRDGAPWTVSAPALPAATAALWRPYRSWGLR